MFPKAIPGILLIGATAGFAAPPAAELAGLWGRDAVLREFMPPLERGGRRTTWLAVTPAPGCGGSCLEGKVRSHGVSTRRQDNVWSFFRQGRFYTVVDAMPLLNGHPGIVVTEAVPMTRRATPDLPFTVPPARPVMDVDLGASRTMIVPVPTTATVKQWVAQAERQGFTTRETGLDGVWRCERPGRRLYLQVLSESGRRTALIMDIRE